MPQSLALAPLWTLPAELIDEILCLLPPRDIFSFGRTCKQAQLFARPGNNGIWRPVFLQHFEDPHDAWRRLTTSARTANAAQEQGWGWYSGLQRRFQARRIILSDGVDIAVKQERYEEVVETLLDIVETGRHGHVYFNHSCPILKQEGYICRNTEFLRGIFALPKADAFLHDFHGGPDSALPYSETPDGPQTRSKTSLRTVPECASRLHLYHGPIDAEQKTEAKSNARAIVYDWSIVGPETEYSPLLKDGSGKVNWALLEAIASLMAIPMHSNARDYTTCPIKKPALPSPSATPGSKSSTVMFDWAGLSSPGISWMGTYAFLDYTDLAWYNYERERGERPGLQGFDEAVGLLSKQTLTLDPSLCDDPTLQTTLPYCDDLPPLYFSGTSRSVGIMPQHDIGLRGVVMLCPGGKEVRWRFVVHYNNTDQWQLEGIQLGGICTGPVYGLWTACDHEQNGPLGPFVYFMEEDTRREISLK